MKNCKNCKQGFTTKHKQAVYCSNSCQQAFQNAGVIKKWKKGLFKGVKGKQFQISNVVRNYLIEKHGKKCSSCGWKKKHPMSGKVPLQIHHIDGNALNSVESNLQVLCPNCHALTDNYGARNKLGRGKRNKILLNR